MTSQAEFFSAIAELGQKFGPDVNAITRKLASEWHDRAALDAMPVMRDIYYGEDQRNRLDLYGADDAADLRPVVLFVHGGGFVAGDKAAADGAPFYQNVGAWAAAHGMACAAMTYRLAPTNRWPAGAEDIAGAVAWLHRHGRGHGIDPSRIILMGQSAGAVHVATYLAHPALQSVAGGGVMAAILLSGLYDMTVAADNPPKFAYFGKDAARYSEQSSLAGLVEHCTIPMLVGVCELDPPDFQQQALLLVAALFEKHQRLPLLNSQAQHNHVSAIYMLGGRHDTLGGPLASFIAPLFSQTQQEPQNA